MFEKVFNYFKNKKLEKDFLNYAKENNFYIHGWGGLNINNMVVHEFGYLLNLVSNGKFTGFNSLEAISNKSEELMNGCDRELRKTPLWEQGAFNVSSKTAIENLKELRVIILEIDKFMKFCDKLGISENEAYSLSSKLFTTK